MGSIRCVGRAQISGTHLFPSDEDLSDEDEYHFSLARVVLVNVDGVSHNSRNGAGSMASTHSLWIMVWYC